MIRVALLDDYQDVALASADWGSLGGEASVEAFTRWHTLTTSTPGRAYPF